MSSLMLDAFYRDPPLALAIMIIIVLLIYIEIMYLRILFITKTLEVAINAMRQESQRGGMGCAGTILYATIITVIIFIALMKSGW